MAIEILLGKVPLMLQCISKRFSDGTSYTIEFHHLLNFHFVSFSGALSVQIYVAMDRIDLARLTIVLLFSNILFVMRNNLLLFLQEIKI